ncbi:hypothetical protein D3C75_1288200 [compost metagenome]
MLTAAFQVDDSALAKLGMAHALPKLVTSVVFTDRRPHPAVAHRAGDTGPQAHLFHTVFRDLTDKA